MSLNPLAQAFLSDYQSSSDLPISLCNSLTMSLPLAQKFRGMPPPIIPSPDPLINQPITDGIFILPLIQPTDQSKQDAAAHQLPPGSSSLLPSALQFQANCLQAVHKAIQQFNQLLKAEHLDRQTLQLLVLQLQIDFALLRYLLFTSVGTISNKDIAVKNSATSPLINSNLSSNPTSNALLLPCADAQSLRRSTPVGAVGPCTAKTNNFAIADFQPTPNTQGAPPTTVQNLSSRISTLEKLFADEIAASTSITVGIYSQCFFFYYKIHQLEAGISDATIRKNPSVNFVLDSAKMAPSSSHPLIEPTTSFTSPIFKTHPHGYNFFIKLYPYGIWRATGKCVSILFTLFPGDYDNPLQWPISNLIHIGIWDQQDPLYTWMKTFRLDQDPAYKKPTMSTKTGVATILINNFYSSL